MNSEQAKFQIDNLVRLSRTQKLHTTFTLHIDENGLIKPEITFKNNNAEVVLSKDLLDKALAPMNNSKP